MEVFVFIILCILIIIIVTNILIKLKLKKQSEIVISEFNLSNTNSENNNENYFPIVEIIENNSLIPQEKNKINDSNIKNAISLIDNTVVNSTSIVKNIKNAKELLKKDKVFFSTSKNGTKNMLSVKKSNEVYGIQMKNNKFNKQTKFLNENKIIENSAKNQIVNASFSATSMIVGQYYMNEINNKLEDIKTEINEIISFQDTEYQSKILHIISKMQEISDNKLEILNNDYSRDKRYNEIINLEDECTILLGQANEEIINNIIYEKINYKKYENAIKTINKWFIRQQVLQTLLLEIGNLRYVLAYGNETSKLSHTQYNRYLIKTNNVNSELEKWHKENCERLGIDIEEQRRNGKFFAIRKNTIGKIKEEWSYSKLENNVIKQIEEQTSIKKMIPYVNEKQDEKIKIQRYKGEYYNLTNYK